MSGRTSSLRTSETSRCGSCGSSGANACTAPRWKTLPSTAPDSSTLRSEESSWSSLATSSAWIVGGTMIWPSPASRTSASISSTKSGLPSAASRTAREAPARRRPAARVAHQSRPPRAVRAGRSWSSASHRPMRTACREARDGPCTGVAAAPPGRGRQRARSGRGTSPRPSGCRRRRTRAAAHLPAPRAACGRPRRSPPRVVPSSVSPSSERSGAAARIGR